MLVWGASARTGGGVRAIRLDGVGNARGSERAVVMPGLHAQEDVPSLAVDVVAATAGGRLGVAWLQPYSRGFESYSTFGPDSVDTFAPAERLEDSERPTGRRGMLAMAASDDGTLMLTYRVMRARCEASASPECARYKRRVIGAAPGASPRGIETLEVAQPCEPLVSTSAWVDGSWYGATCSVVAGTTETAMHVFVLRREISYAAVMPLLPGCRPRGLVALPDGAVALAQCPDGLGAVQLALDGQTRQTVRAAELVPRCSNGRPELGVERGAGRIGLPLGAPLSRIEAMLPNDVAPPGARAVWTGESVLVAVAVGSEVALRRYQCGEVRLGRTDPR